MADKMKKAVEEVKAETAKAVEEVKAEVKPTVEKAVKATRKTAAKATEKVKKTAAKAVGAEVSPVVYVQYQGEEEKIEDLVAAAKAAFAAEHARTKVSDLKLYIKPEERAAYYVVNEKFAGRVDF
ncbi:MAG: hypothetical protein IJQ98_03815 [Oscillospiraceae bacterium]|nr:hypothetical protein [Oscillospiraceae bacterium]